MNPLQSRSPQNPLQSLLQSRNLQSPLQSRSPQSPVQESSESSPGVLRVHFRACSSLEALRVHFRARCRPGVHPSATQAPCPAGFASFILAVNSALEGLCPALASCPVGAPWHPCLPLFPGPLPLHGPGPPSLPLIRYNCSV